MTTANKILKLHFQNSTKDRMTNFNNSVAAKRRGDNNKKNFLWNRLYKLSLALYFYYSVLWSSFSERII